jgi:PEP-CTERM motif
LQTGVRELTYSFLHNLPNMPLSTSRCPSCWSYLGRCFFFASLFLINVVSGSKARCDLILGNLASSSNDTGALAAFESSVAYSIGFTVGATPLTLSSVDIRLRSNTDPGFATLQLRSDVGGNPASTALSTFGNQLVTSSFGTITFAPSGPVSLTAGTKYWLTIGTLMQAPNGLIIGANGTTNLPTGTLASFDGIRSGLANNQSTDVSGFVSTPTFAINGSIAAVPEPTSIALVGFACSLVALRLRRKTRK